MSDELYGRLEKYMEGTSLGLAALSEVLTKMDARLTKAENEQVTVEIAKAEEEERTSLIKDVATAVAGLLKATDDLDGSKVRTAKKSGALNADGNDSSATVTPPSAAPDQQATIQAEKEKDEDEDDIEEAEYPMKEGEEDEEVPARARASDDKDLESEDKPEEDEDVEDAMVQRMKKQIDDLQKQITEYEGSLSKAVSEETETRLRKMGFKEERRLVAPTQLTSFGQDEVKIVKASPTGDDITEQLADLSYSELRKLQHKVEKGEITLN